MENNKKVELLNELKSLIEVSSDKFIEEINSFDINNFEKLKDTLSDLNFSSFGLINQKLEDIDRLYMNEKINRVKERAIDYMKENLGFSDPKELIGKYWKENKGQGAYIIGKIKSIQEDNHRPIIRINSKIIKVNCEVFNPYIFLPTHVISFSFLEKEKQDLSDQSYDENVWRKFIDSLNEEDNDNNKILYGEAKQKWLDRMESYKDYI